MNTYIDQTAFKDRDPEVRGSLVTLNGDTFYKVSSVHAMRPFFMSLVSDANHWMFLSSNGGLTAGRKDSELALFPYYTDDKITESIEHTGCKTIFRVDTGNGVQLWEPFSERYQYMYTISRNLYKSIYGNTIIFEEINEELQLIFRYQWASSNSYGFLRTATLEDTSGNKREVSILDGVQNVLPWGLATAMQSARSNLADAYKKNECVLKTGLGIYALSAFIVDRAEPSESLKANTIWSHGLTGAKTLISSLQLDAFRRGESLQEQSVVRGERGAYFKQAQVSIPPAGQKQWWLVANVNQGPAAVEDINRSLEKDPAGLIDLVNADVAAGTRRLLALTGASDGLQLTRDSLTTARHYANVMYNIMRGGIMDDNYSLERSDFEPYLIGANKALASKYTGLLDDLGEKFTLFELRKQAMNTHDPDFIRLALEYLPLKFSRRHGDPSRPWNKFSINTQRESDGSKILDYQGNWRDIFQNWEALAQSYPEYIDGMIHKFLNASTADGYNPYRITKGGIDWEIIEPDDTWTFIGYWGDHQLIYFLKFLEISEAYFPGRLLNYWGAECFVYANVPYRIKAYRDILKNSKDTIDFDAAMDKELRQKMREMGADAALLPGNDRGLARANLIEKILVSVLAKVSNFVPEAGIWLTTQRPEWNDANNALVGNGVSMVTLYYLKRYLVFMSDFLQKHRPENVAVSSEVLGLLRSCTQVLEKHQGALSSGITDSIRRQVTDGLGDAGSAYREAIYNRGFEGHKEELSSEVLSEFLKIADAWVEQTIQANRREDELYHAYNLIKIEGDTGISIRYLPEMLEGQVAALSSGFLGSEETLGLLDALRKSALYREDQNSYILYPDRQLPAFRNKNAIPAESVAGSGLLSRLIADGNRAILEKDSSGGYHFNGAFHNATNLSEALDKLPEKYRIQASEEKEELLELFESIFDHASFTGRSGTFFAYEGLGSIYWHMVSKLLLAVQECCVRAETDGTPAEVRERLNAHYDEIKAGIGVHKEPQVYGAMPIDPYSHTPAHKGAQQPGMTGQVKEDVLTRNRELGVCIAEGSISFDPFLLNQSEYLDQDHSFDYFDVHGKSNTLKLPAESLVFTICQVPVVFHASKEKKGIELLAKDGELTRINGLRINPDASSAIFQRTGEYTRIDVFL